MIFTQHRRGHAEHYAALWLVSWIGSVDRSDREKPHVSGLELIVYCNNVIPHHGQMLHW